jgi:hypothetical protein
VYGLTPTGTNAPNTFAVKVSIYRVHGAESMSSPTVVTSTAVVVAPPFTGGLDPTSDTGASNSDGVTRINQPVFRGTAAPFSLVQLFVLGRGMSSPVPLGQSVAGADGTWRATASPLADGFYTVTAHVTPPNGSPMTVTNLPPLVIDTVAPIVTGVTYDRRSGRIAVTFRDSGSGMDRATLVDPVNYNLIGHPRRRLASFFPPALVTTQITPSDPQTVVVTLTPRPGERGLTTLRVLSGGIADVAGNPLAGAGGVAGTNYVAPLSSLPAPQRPSPVHAARHGPGRLR